MFDGGVKLFDGLPTRSRHRVGGVSQNRSVRSKDAPVESAVEKGDATTVWREDVCVRLDRCSISPRRRSCWRSYGHLTRGRGSAEQLRQCVADASADLGVARADRLTLNRITEEIWRSNQARADQGV